MSDSFTTWTLRRTIPSEIDAGHEVLEEMLDRFKTEGWTTRDMCHIRLALEEAIVNAIKHGNRLDASKVVLVHCESTDEKIWIQVTDQGEGFDPEKVPDCTDAEHIDAPNGRGIFLMRNFMSFVAYSDSGTRVTLEKRRGHSASFPCEQD